jgi:hypothetical protein
MQVKLATPIVTSRDEQMVDDLTLRDPATGAPLGPVNRVPITAGYLIIEAVWGADPEGKRLSAAEHLERFEIAQKVKAAAKAGHDAELDEKERTTVLAIAEKKWPPGIYGQLAAVLRDPRPAGA